MRFSSKAVPVKVIVELSDGYRKSLSGKRLQEFLVNARNVIVFAQKEAGVFQSWAIDDWEDEIA